VRRDQHQIAFGDPMPASHGSDDLTLKCGSKNVYVRTHEYGPTPPAVFDRNRTSPEGGRDAFRRPVPMTVSPDPTQFTGCDFSFTRSYTEFLRERGTGTQARQKSDER
jgi:hypothetical protein